MNFLPIETQTLFKKQYKRKVFIFFAAIVLFLLIVNLVLLFPSHIFLKTSVLDVKRQLEIANQNSVFIRFKETQIALEKLNAETDFLNTKKNEIRNIAPLFKKITDLKKEATEDISINFMSFEKKKNKIALQGEAETRASLLKFINSLENKDDFLKIKSPPSNLLKENNINYSLDIFLK